MSLKSEEDVRANSSSSEHADDETVENASNSSIKETSDTIDLPEEVWEIILNMLTEDEDRINCCRASPLFDRLLTGSKPVWMFKQILPIVDRVTMFTKNPFFTVEVVKSCRRVCKQWCTDFHDFAM